MADCSKCRYNYFGYCKINQGDAFPGSRCFRFAPRDNKILRDIYSFLISEYSPPCLSIIIYRGYGGVSF